MTKILTIAMREYRAMVGTKAFMISLIMMPILMFAGIIAMELLKDVGQTKQRSLVVVDHSGHFLKPLLKAANDRNSQIQQAQSADDTVADQPLPGIVPETYVIIDKSDLAINAQTRFELSEQIRNNRLYAFVEIPENVLELNPESPANIQFYAQDSSISIARRWLTEVLSRIAKEKRLEKSGLSSQQISTFRKFDQGVTVQGQGLMKRALDGTIVASEEKEMLLALFLPLGTMMLMFMVIFMASQPMLESVLEEKSQRIAEVLLGSASPFELMMGKLIGTVAGSLTIFAIYFLGTYSVAGFQDWTSHIPLAIVPWFVVFQVVGVLFYAAIFMAVGASVSQLKEAQSLLLPVWVMLMTPLFVWFIIVRDPQGPLALSLSMIPPTAPTTMMLRMATGQSIPLWQPLLSLVSTCAATLVVVVLAGRIFRVGILWQGKRPRLNEILRWAIVGQ